MPDFLLGLSTGTRSVGPGAWETFSAMPQLAGDMVSLLISRETANSFELCDIKIGKNSMFVSASPVPLAIFATAHKEDFPDTGQLRLMEKECSGLFKLERVLPGMCITVDVQNTGVGSVPFQGALVYRVAAGYPNCRYCGTADSVSPSRVCITCHGSGSDACLWCGGPVPSRDGKRCPTDPGARVTRWCEMRAGTHLPA